MGTLVITPSTKEQSEQIKAFAEQLGLKVKELNRIEKEDLGLLKAMELGEERKSNVKLSTFMKNLSK